MATASLVSGEDLNKPKGKRGKGAASKGGAMTLSKGYATVKANSGLLLLGIAGFTAANRLAAKNNIKWRETWIPLWERYVDSRAVFGVAALALCHFAPKQVGAHSKNLFTLGTASLFSYGLDMIADKLSAPASAERDPRTDGVGATEVGRSWGSGGYDADLSRLRALRARQLEASDGDLADAGIPVGAYANAD